jgi:hypothetical protein
MKKYLHLPFIVLFAATLISWGVVGHKTVATIATNHLSDRAQTTVKYLLGDTTLADISSWADQVLREPQYKNTAPQHYANVPLGLNYQAFTEAIKSQPQDNVYKAILKNVDILKDESSTIEQRRSALKFVVHFVGDLHQPMHISRAEDKGGNTIQLQFDGKGTNLHSLWDSKLIGKEGKTFEQMSIDYDKATPAQIKQWQSDDIMKWLYESYQISTRLYSEIEQNNKLNDAYYKSHINIVNDRVEMAGIRLAGLLNNIFSTSIYKALRSKIAVALENRPLPKEIKLNEVGQHIGELVSVRGEVKDEKQVPGMLLLNLGAAYPNQTLTVVLKGTAIDTYKKYNSKDITARGKIIIYKDKPEIIINNVVDLTIMRTIE